MALSAGDKIGPYEILAAIGAGGMGEVYRARDTKLKRDVALKVLPEAFAADRERMARFQREAEVLASLNHPNIAQIYGVEDRALVMELVEGESPKGPMAFDEAWKIAEQIAAALEYAHERGIVHRDLKPANIKVRPDGVVKLLDFGLAKAFGTAPAAVNGSGADDSPTLTMGATQAGAILGTAAYMAPEQATGKSIDQRADIWAFGVMLYELLSGRRPFRGDTVSETLAAVITKEADLDPIPARARPLLEHCLEKDAKKRLRHIGDMALLLGAAPRAMAPPPRNRLLIGGLTLVTLALAAVSAIHFGEKIPAAEPARMSILLPAKSRALSLAVSPNGREIAMVLVKEGRQQIWLRALDSLEPKVLEGTDNAADPFWSPDSRFIGFFADAKLKKVDHAGGPVQTLCDAVGALGATWNARDEILMGALAKLQKVSAVDGTVSDISKPGGVRNVYPFFLPDGRHFLATQQGTGPQAGVWLGALDGSEARRILPDVSKAEFTELPGSSNGEILFFRADKLMAVPFDRKRLQAAGDVFPAAQGVQLAGVSNQGVLVYVQGHRGRREYVWRDRQGKNLGTAGEARSVVAISPDGKRLVGDRDGTWILELASGAATSLITGAGNQNPIWSSDGRYIAYWGQGGIYRKAANGAGAPEMLTPATGLVAPKSWSPDGRFLIYTQVNRGTGADVMALPLEGERKPFPVAQTSANEDQGQFSPDGHWVAYTSNETGLSEIYVVPFPPSASGGKWLVSKGGGVQPRWRRDGKELFYISPDWKMMAVEVHTQPVFQAGNPQTLFPTEMADTGIRTGPMSWDIAPDGNRFLIVTDSPEETPSMTVVLNWRPAVER